MEDAKYGGVLVDLLPGIIEENLQQFYDFLTQHTTCSQPSLHGVRWMSPEHSTWPNLICSAELNTDSLETDLVQIIAGIQEKAIPPVWLVGPLTRPLGLPEVLERHGFLAGMQWSGMALALDGLDLMEQKMAQQTEQKMAQQTEQKTEQKTEQRTEQKMELMQSGSVSAFDWLAREHTGLARDLEDFTIQVVDNTQVLGEWLEVVQNGLLHNSQIDLEYFANLLGPGEVRFYLGRVAGKPVGTSCLFLASHSKPRIAGLYLIAVLPEYRERGIGRLMTLRPLLDAEQLGCQLAVLQATQLGEKVYRKIGFHEFCQFRFYKYQS